MTGIAIHPPKKLNNTAIILPGSKSECNRVLIINSLCDQPGQPKNISQARDSQIMQQLLQQQCEVFDVQDAGTVMRFITAFLVVKGKTATITGTARMQNRPIGILVEALIKLGAKMEYLGEEGYPPIHINSFDQQLVNTIEIESDISSQYISALLMIAPNLDDGLNIVLKGSAVSQPYIDLTISIMKHFGVSVNKTKNGYHIPPQSYVYTPYTIEADWSAASYWYSLFALSDMQTLTLLGLKDNSLQGDRVVAEMMRDFGIETKFSQNGAELIKINANYPEQLDFIDCPDLAQTVAVLCAAIGHTCLFTGLQTLKIKETNRLKAIQSELRKIDADFQTIGTNWKVIPAKTPFALSSDIQIDTYDDHRMAMAFTPLALFGPIRFNDADVVNKSYPNFWKDLEQIGFTVDSNN